MPPKRIPLDSWEAHLAHRAKLIAKLQRIQTLSALIDSWQSHPNPDHSYLRQLKRKLRSAEHQYEAMQP